MKFDREKYNKDQRVIGYIPAEKKRELKQAVSDGVAPSVSRLTSDIIKDHATDHIKKLTDD